MHPELSIVVPTCGRVALFAETLASLAAQKHRDFEVVVPDDSKLEADRLAIRELVESFQRDTAISARYLYSRSSLYQAGNTNQGLAAVSGKWIRILHSDDLLAPEALQFEHDLLREFEGKVEVIFHWLLPFSDRPDFLADPAVKLISPEYLLRNTLHSATSCPSGLLFSREVLQQVKGMNTELRFLCDWELFFDIVIDQYRKGKFLANVAPGLCGWRVHGDNVTSRLWFNHYIEHKAVTRTMLSTLSKLDSFPFDAMDRRDFENTATVYRYSRLLSDYCRLPLPGKVGSLRKVIGALAELVAAPGAVGYGLVALANRVLKRVGPTLVAQLAMDPVPVEQKLSGLDGGDILALRPSIYPKSLETGRAILVSFQNDLDLAPLSDLIARFPKVMVFDLNLNRFHEKVLFELGKHTAVGQEFIFVLEDNEHLTLFGLKALIEKVFPEQFTVLDQKGLGRNQNLVHFSRHSPVPDYLSSGHDGWTFGLLTMGTREAEVMAFIDSVRSFCPDPYEIIITTPARIGWLEGEPDVRQIVFSEKDELGWITRKKNLICSEARYSDIVVCHDRFVFTEGFFAGAARTGFRYGLAAPRLTLPDGKRALDWGMVSSNNHVWSFGGLLDYRAYSPYAYVPGGVTVLRKEFWRRFPWNENLFWNEHEDVELCRRAQRGGHVLTLLPATMVAQFDRWVEQNRLIPFDDQEEVVYGSPVGEQVIRFRAGLSRRVRVARPVKRIKRWLINLVR